MAFESKQKTRQQTIPYFSAEWVEEVTKWTNADKKMQNIGRRLNEKHCYIVLDCPRDTDRLGWFQFKGGQIVDCGYEEHESPADFSHMPMLDGADFITTANYEFMKRVNTKQINAMKALMSPDMALQGSKSRLMKQVKQLQHWQDLFIQIPVEYDV
jgi:hypothetical protein